MSRSTPGGIMAAARRAVDHGRRVVVPGGQRHPASAQHDAGGHCRVLCCGQIDLDRHAFLQFWTDPTDDVVVGWCMTTGLMLGDGGIETDLIFHHGQDLPHFAAFVLLDTNEGRQALRDYYRPYFQIARDARTGLVLEAPTWRASGDWLALLGRPVEDVTRVNVEAVRLVADLRAEHGDIPGDQGVQHVISGCVGPRADGYDVGTTMSEQQSQDYHRPQVDALQSAGADRATAMTLSYAAEAVGIVRAAQVAGIPVVISFTVETDGRLPDGSSLEQAIRAVDSATDQGAEFFMVNCAHPTHIVRALDPSGTPDDHRWLSRVRGVRANASTRSHAEMDVAPDLDEGDPESFGAELAGLHDRLPSLQVLGGCCGTDQRHIRAVAQAVTAHTGGPAG
ncbi:MAG TPA: homocysteine S-methyltransferase family protein [Dermatophilaceae bacterium]